MREMTMNHWCDSCFLEAQTKEPAVHTFTVGACTGESRPALKVLELCERHSKLVLDLQALLAETGQVPEPAKLTARLAPLKKRSALTPCPVCQGTVPRNTMVAHVWRHHRTDERPKTDAKCPTCHEQQRDGAGLAAHRRIAHEYDALADALAGVKGYRPR